MKAGFTIGCMVMVAGLAAAVAGMVRADERRREPREEVIRATLVGYSEVPSVSTPARGQFRAVIDDEAGTITYKLSYSGIGAVTQSHLHLGQHHTNGGIMVFLCTNLGNNPPNTAVQACPTVQPAEIAGVIRAADVTGTTGTGIPTQGIAPGEFSELVAAIRSGAVYVNIHSTPSPGGEIRGQLLH